MIRNSNEAMYKCKSFMKGLLLHLQWSKVTLKKSMLIKITRSVLFIFYADIVHGRKCQKLHNK